MKQRVALFSLTSMATLIAALLVALAMPFPARAEAARGDAPTRDAMLRTLGGKLELPLVDETVTTFAKRLRGVLPAIFVAALGQGANLGAIWKRGNPWFDRALTQIDGALAAEEQRGGPLLTLAKGDLLTIVDVPWTEDDLRFLIATSNTELGRQAQRAIDAKAVLQLTQTLARRIANQPGAEALAASFGDLELRAQTQLGDAATMLLALKGVDPARAKRLEALLNQISTGPNDAYGKRLTDRLSQRLLEAAAAQVPNLIAIIAGFKAAHP